MKYPMTREDATARYLDLIEEQREERRRNPKLGQIGPDGYCPRTEITDEMEQRWAEAGMPRHA